MLHKRLYYLKNGALVKSFAPISAQEIVKLISEAEEEAEVQEQPKKMSCKEKVMEVIDPILTPIAQSVADHERQIKLLTEKIEALESVLTSALPDEDLNSSAFLLKFPTEEDFKKAEPCLRSLSDLLEKQNINFEILELS